MKKTILLFISISFHALLFAQNVGIGTNTPAARLHVADSSVLFSGAPALDNPPGNTPVSGPGVRMMWYPDKASIRAGIVDGTQWDKDVIGNASAAFGRNTRATALASFATGYSSIAAGPSSVAMGQNAAATATAATAMGYETWAEGQSSVAMGQLSRASGMVSMATGSGTVASGTSAAAFGNYSASNGAASVAMGSFSIANSNYSLVIGKYNDANGSNRLFEIGNGTANNARSNAFTVLDNGKVGIGTSAPANQTEIIATSGLPVTLTIGNRAGFGAAALEFVSDYGLANQWRPGYISSQDYGSYTGVLEFFTNGSGSGALYGNSKALILTNGGAFTSSGAVGSFSDLRIKKNIVPFRDGLDVITKINPVRYNYNNLSPFMTDKDQVGIIAQELEKVAPYMVDTTSQNGMDDLRSVNSQAYVFLLINAVKELSEQNKAQQKQLDEQKKLIERLLK